MRGSRYSRLISLGRACECAHQIRRYTGIETAAYFDWLITPHSGLVKALRLRFEGCFMEENLVISDDRTTIRDSLTGIVYHHNFSRLSDMVTIDPLAVGREYKRESEKMGFLARRWFEITEKTQVLFVRHDAPSIQQAQEVYQVLSEQMKDRLPFVLFVVPPEHELPISQPGIFVEKCRTVSGSSAWFGESEAWDNVLCKYWASSGIAWRSPHLNGPLDPDPDLRAARKELLP